MIATRSTISENRINRLEPRFSPNYLVSQPRTRPVLRHLEFHDWPIQAGRPSMPSCDDWLANAQEQLAAISELGSGWDSHGADPPDLAAIYGAWSLLRSLGETGLVPKPHIYPSRSGGIQLEWEGDGKYLEIELLYETEARYFFSDTTDRIEAEGVLEQGRSLDEVIELIERTRL